MEWILLVIGLILILAAALDALWTTFWVDGGAAPLSGRILSVVQDTFARVTPRHRHAVLSLTGPASMFLILGVWVLLTWVGWTLVFSADPGAVAHATTGAQAGPIDRAYYCGYVLFTLGTGDFVPVGAVWQILSGVAALNGLTLITLGLTYLITVISAVVERRAVAIELSTIADRPEGLLLAAWDGSRFVGLEEMLRTMTHTIARTAERHLAYPVLHAYHARDARKSLSVALAVLDEALTLLRYGVKPEARPGRIPLEMARGIIATYLETLRPQGLDASDQVPPPPSLEALRTAGVPVVTDREFQGSLDAIAERRRLLLGNLRSEHWEWEVVER